MLTLLIYQYLNPSITQRTVGERLKCVFGCPDPFNQKLKLFSKESRYGLVCWAHDSSWVQNPILDWADLLYLCFVDSLRNYNTIAYGNNRLSVSSDIPDIPWLQILKIIKWNDYLSPQKVAWKCCKLVKAICLTAALYLPSQNSRSKLTKKASV